MALKGFYLTLDGLFALTILVVVLILISNQLFQPVTPRGMYLKQVSYDLLEVMDKTDRAEHALFLGNTTAVRELLESFPIQVCAQVHFENTVSGSIITITRPTCGGFGTQLQATYRPMSIRGIRYMVKVESWYNS